MRAYGLLALALVAPAVAGAKPKPLPPDVDAFVRDRDACDHFRGEPIEGDEPEQVKRREFVRESLEIYCPGTDRRLAALKKRYRRDKAMMKVLAEYEDKIER